MKKLFILTGEPSGDKLASEVISKLKKIDPDIEYLSVGGENLESLGIQSIYKLKEVTYIGITKVLLNIFKIKKKINETVKKILEFDPDILFSVDSPDFTLRVVEQVKKSKSSIKTIHYVAPQVWVWREHRVKKFKNFLDHILLLFNFEKKYFDKENIKNTFVGHPLLDKKKMGKIDISSLISDDKKIISIFPGSRISELNALLEGYIIIEKGRNSDILTIYLQTEFYDEYYFQYKNGVMRAWSTNPDFTTAITEVSDEKRRAKGKKGTNPYRYMTAPEDVTEKFLKDVKKKY